MKLKELLKLINDYDQSWSFHQLMYGDHDEVTQIKDYIKKYKNESNDYELTHFDIFDLIKIIHIDSNLQIIRSIKNNISHYHLFAIFDVLYKAELLNKNNFSVIYDMSYEERSLLYNLYCSQKKPISLKLEVFETLLGISRNSYFPREGIEKSFNILKKEDLLIPIALNLFKEKSEELKPLCKLIEELHRANYLNEVSLECLGKLKSFYTLPDLLQLLNQTKITINKELLNQLVLNENLHYLLKILPCLIEAKEGLFNTEVFIMLLKQDFKFFIDKTPVINLLQKHEMLNSKTFEFVCNNDDFSFYQNLKILSAESLLNDNQELVSKLLNQEINCFRLYRAIDYLQKADLLDQGLLDWCIKLIPLKSEKEFIRKDIFDLFQLFEESKIVLNKNMLKVLMSLTESNIQRVYTVVLNLKIYKLLDKGSIEKTIQRVSEKLSSVEESKIVKNNEKNKDSRTEVILDSKYRFFMEHNKDLSGGFGIIKKGYGSPESDQPLYVIKKLKETDLAKSEQEAVREVKYHRLLGRQAFYFSKNGKTIIVSEWQYEKGLDLFNLKELTEVSIEKRLQCLVSGLSDLNKLHAHYRIHGDVKCQNYILDLKNSSMKLIDFGTSHKKGSSKSFAWTPEYAEPNTDGDHFYKDIYAMGIVTMHLFPELYSVSFIEKKANISMNKSKFTISEQAIINLVNSMMSLDHKVRCTSEDALNYCKELIININDLNETLLEKIANTTLNHSNITIEDVFRETKRVLN